MSYVTQPPTARPAAMLGAVGIPAAFAGLLVIGLAVDVIADAIPDDFVAITPTTQVPPPPPEPTPPQQPTESVVSAPKPPISIPDTSPPQFSISEPDFTSNNTSTIVGTLPPLDPGTISTPPLSSLGFDPVSATPRNQPSRWVTNGDYRPRWVREGLSGTARFDLAISSQGRVTNCTITKSTGHAQLDTATCKLIAKRARFNPALNSNGDPVSGSYSSAVNWQLPD